MRLSKGVLYAGLALALCALGTPAKAGSVSGDTAAGFADVTGTAAGATVVSVPSTTVTSVNGLPSTGLTLGIAENITAFTGPVGGVDTITAGTGTKVISDGSGDSVLLNLRIVSGTADDGSLSTTAVITNASGSSDVGGFNFASLVGGITTIVDNQATTDFTLVLGHTGVTANGGTLSVTESVPEPTSMALLGIGMAGFFTYRRLFKRPATV
jgi:hypothetical protein